MMRCIVVDDEPIARRGMERLAAAEPQLEVVGTFGSAEEAAEFMAANGVDLVFLDIRMPGVSGVEFAATIPRQTLVVFTTAFSQYALEGYEVDAVDYLVKPIEPARFRRAVEKAAAYHALLVAATADDSTVVDAPAGAVADHVGVDEARGGSTGEGGAGVDFIFVKSDRRFFRVALRDILFIEGLKDYVVIQTEGRRLVTHMNLKTIHELLPAAIFLRANRSYIVNRDRVDSFTASDVFVGPHEIAIGESYCEPFLKALMDS